MASSQAGSFRWRPASFVARPVPPRLIHDLMQPLSAYGLAAEQLRIRLRNELSPKSPAFDELAAMNGVIGELEASLWLLQEFWRLDSQSHAPALLPTSLDAVLKIVVNRLEKRRPGLSWSMRGQKNNPCVQSSALWLGTLLSCIFESLIQKGLSGLDVEIIAREREVEIAVREKLNDGVQTLVFGIGDASNSSAESGNSELALQIATSVASILKGRLSVHEREISLVLPASTEADYLSAGAPELRDVFSGRQIAIFETDRAFLNDLTVLFRSWGGEVFHLSSIDEVRKYAESGKPADALFLDFEVWRDLHQEKAGSGCCSEISRNIFVTVGKDFRAQVPLDVEGCVFLPRPLSPVRLRKYMMSLFSVAATK